MQIIYTVLGIGVIYMAVGSDRYCDELESTNTLEKHSKSESFI